MYVSIVKLKGDIYAKHLQKYDTRIYSTHDHTTLFSRVLALSDQCCTDINTIFLILSLIEFFKMTKTREHDPLNITIVMLLTALIIKALKF